jgi:GR25 family glycosyltransferase involved in LPS biosynthesis
MKPIIHVITLERTPERTKEFQRGNSHIDYHFFDAVDGIKIPEHEDLSSIICNRKNITPGALGCLLSHVSLWMLAVKNNSTLTICEDDAIFCANFEEIYEYNMAKINEFDIIHWGFNQDRSVKVKYNEFFTNVNISFDQNSTRRNIHNFKYITIENCTLHKTLSIWGTPCYTISPNGARKLMAAILPLTDKILNPLTGELQKNWGIDSAINSIIPIINGYCIVPPTVVTPNIIEDSTIQQG